MVASASLPPAVAITSPTNSQFFFPAPAAFTFSADATDTDGPIANVEFFNNLTSLGVDTTFQYSIPVSGLAAGSYTFRAVATDNSGLKATNSVSFTVNAAPSVSITSPSNGNVFLAPASFAFSANASDTGGGTITQVQFFTNNVLAGTDTSSPFSTNLLNLAAGAYTLRAEATDNNGTKATNSISITVNAPPTVSITSPTNGSTFVASANFTISANASDTGGGSVTNVEFFDNGLLLGADATSNYTWIVTNLAAGAHTLSAVASDNLNAKATNSVNITVNSNTPPTVAITNPVEGVAFIAGATVGIKVAASDPGGSVTNVTLRTNGTIAGSLPGPAFNFSIGFPLAGNFALTAVAADNLGLQATSAPVNIFILTNSALTNFTTLTNGATQFQVIGITGQTYFIDASSNLVDWVPIATNVAPGTTFPVTDSGAPANPYRFYRARQMAQ